MSDFLAGLQTYLASDERAREVELADASPAFEPAEYAGRLDRLRRAMSETGVDVVLLTRPESMCWLHGYTARWYRHGGPPEWPALTTSVVRADRDEIIHFDFGGEEELLSATSVCRDVRTYPGTAVEDSLAFLVRELTSAGWLAGLVGRERRGLPPDQRTGEAIEEAIVAAGCKIDDATALIDRLLHLKSPAEVERIEAAGRVLDIGLRAAVEVIAPGVTELEVWGEMMLAMAKAGGQPAALHEMVASGPVFLPHAISGRRALRRDEIVSLDPCGVVDRYHANAARAVWIGTPPDSLVELYRRAAEGFRIFCAEARPGRHVEEVGRAMKAWYEDSGIWDMRSWCGGYDLGLAFRRIGWVPGSSTSTRRSPAKYSRQEWSPTSNASSGLSSSTRSSTQKTAPASSRPSLASCLWQHLDQVLAALMTGAGLRPFEDYQAAASPGKANRRSMMPRFPAAAARRCRR